MELRHLRYFVAVAENLSFRRAAERLHLTRPALSKQIKELEAEVGVKLFERTTARVGLTGPGAVYLHEVRKILDRIEQAGALVREAHAGRRGRLSIGEVGALGLTFMTSVLSNFREQFPHVEVSLEEIPPHDHASALENGEIDIGFLVSDGPIPANLDSFVVIELRMGVAVNRSHPLARRKRLEIGDLAGQSFICIGDARRSEHAQYIRRLLASGEPRNHPLRGVTGIRSLITMIASGHGISILPHSLETLPAGDLVVIPLEGVGPLLDFELQAVWRKQDPSLLLKNFVQTLRRFRKTTRQHHRP